MMSRFLMLAGAAAMASAAPAFAEKPGKGHGPKNSSAKSVGHKASAKASDKAGTKAAKNTIRARSDRNRNGIDDRDEALAQKYGGALCPPGLAKKTPACMPPGQAKRQFREGQRVSTNYRHYSPYSDIPLGFATATPSMTTIGTSIATMSFIRWIHARGWSLISSTQFCSHEAEGATRTSGRPLLPRVLLAFRKRMTAFDRCGQKHLPLQLQLAQRERTLSLSCRKLGQGHADL